MKEKISQYFNEINSINIQNTDDLNQFKIKYLSKKGAINNLFNLFKNVPDHQKKEIGQLLNNLKNLAISKYETATKNISQQQNKTTSLIDTSLPAKPEIGAFHPLTIVLKQIINIFSKIGFTVVEGPEIEDDWHNFSALNFHPNHPARDMQDTFFIDNNFLLRTHTSSVQIRILENNTPPIRILMPGRVYRNEAISARSLCTFNQIEGLYVAKNVSFADLKQTLFYFTKNFFGNDTKIRFRPSFFPFTEPSAEMDVSCNICNSKGCPMCKYSGWLEILGCGMVDPNVLKNCNINPNIYSGYAFGMGIERITSLKYLVDDIRMYYENDLRFLKQFTSAY